MMDKREAECRAADHIVQSTSDWGARMVLGAFAQETINYEYGKDEDGDDGDDDGQG